MRLPRMSAKIVQPTLTTQKELAKRFVWPLSDWQRMNCGGFGAMFALMRFAANALTCDKQLIILTLTHSVFVNRLLRSALLSRPGICT
jgi:hypothetical protein